MIGSILTLCIVGSNAIPDSLLASLEEPWLAPGYTVEELLALNPRELGEPFPEPPSPVPLYAVAPFLHRDSSGVHLRLGIGTASQVLLLEDGQPVRSIEVHLDEIYRVSFSRDVTWAVGLPLPWSDYPCFLLDMLVGEHCSYPSPEGMGIPETDVSHHGFLLVYTGNCTLIEPWTGWRLELLYEYPQEIARAAGGGLCAFLMREGLRHGDFRLAVTDGDGIELWQATGTDEGAMGLCITPDGQTLVVTRESGVEVLDGQTGTLLWSGPGDVFDGSLMTSDDGSKACLCCRSARSVPEHAGEALTRIACLSLRPDIGLLWETCADSRSLAGARVEAVSNEGRCLVLLDGGPDRPFMNGFLLLDGQGLPVWSSGNLEPGFEEIFDATCGSFLEDRATSALFEDLVFYVDRMACRLLRIAPTDQ
ncbi:hypothetical protein JW921_01665 [Candidatus Fermentibacterales bacterium]|nr:hypothetical protein [Candidatus Fermentibacterales bacterium]